MLRGRSDLLRAYEPLSYAVFQEPATTQYCAAFAKLQAGDAAAMPLSQHLSGLHADDGIGWLSPETLAQWRQRCRMQWNDGGREDLDARWS